MRSMKAKVLLAIAAASAPAFAYTAQYTNTDIVAIIIDVIGAVFAFVYDNITLIGILLLLGFIVGVFVELKRKAGM